MVEFKPSILQADAAPAITRGVCYAFGFASEDNFVRLYCWAHVKRNIDKKLNCLKDNETKNQILSDVATIQLAVSMIPRISVQSSYKHR